MSLITSLLFGSEGSYNVLGVDVTFKKKPQTRSSELDIIILKLATKCLDNKFFFIIIQGYLHVFIHEMSHAMASRLFSIGSNIIILTNTCEGTTNCKGNTYWEDTMINAAGSMGSIAFCTCKLALAIILKKYIPFPITLVLGSSALIWIAGELGYTFFSALQIYVGDYGQIARYGNIYLAVASVAILAECILIAFLLTTLNACYN